jgi:hypothetical protein
MQVSTHQAGKSCSVTVVDGAPLPWRDFAWTAALCLRELREDAPVLALAA